MTSISSTFDQDFSAFNPAHAKPNKRRPLFFPWRFEAGSGRRSERTARANEMARLARKAGAFWQGTNLARDWALARGTRWF